MTSKERVLALLDSRPVDHLPALPITMMFAADTAGIRYGEYARDHRALVEAQLKVAETYAFDYVSTISDPAREAADLGGAIEWFDDQPPAIIESRALLEDKSKLAALRVPDPLEAGTRLRDRVDGVRLLKARVGDEKIVEGWVEGPCAQAADLRGVNTLMLDFGDDPEFVRALFDFILEMEVRFARAQVEAGADVIGIGDAAASLVGPRIYEQFIFDYECREIAAIKALGARVRLHICGNTRRIVKWLGQTGAGWVDIDYPVPMAEARAAMGPNVPLLGNLDPVRALMDATPESVTAAVEACHRAAAPLYLVGAGCEIPRGTPPENLRAMIRYARTHGSHPAAS
jgi:MtaA/CmuA family methyltransferase